MKLFVSQPMNGLSNEDILKAREAAVLAAEEKCSHVFDVIDSFFQDAPHDASPDFYEGYKIGFESAQPKWISVDADQKPRHGKEYLCVCSLPDDPKHEWDWMEVLRWFAHGTNGLVDRPHFTNEGLNGMIVTHWMELPKPPKEET